MSGKYRNRPVGTICRMSREHEVDVLVVGAGITGIYQLYRAREAGFSVQLLEAGSGVGGTWYWNRYPGARFDSESYTYAYLFSKELFDDWEWQEHFAEQPETERYLNHVVDRSGRVTLPVGRLPSPSPPDPQPARITERTRSVVARGTRRMGPLWGPRPWPVITPSG